MPPKAKFTKDEILQAALEVVSEEGKDALTARSLGQRLGSSARPIFTVFENMEEVQNGVVARANKIYSVFVEKGLGEKPAFKGVGNAYIRFAIQYPRLFELLFMRRLQHVPDIKDVLGQIEGAYDRILSSIETDYEFNTDNAKKLYRHMWIYTHGIAVLTVTGVCSFSEEELSEMLTEVCLSLIVNYKRGVK